MKKFLFRTMLIIAACASVAWASHPKISHGMDNFDQNAMANVIVHFNTTPTAAHHKKVTDRGGTHRATLGLVKGGAYSIPVSMLNDLANDPDVAYIPPDHPLNSTLDNTTAAVNAGVAWNFGLTGAGIGVPIIDSGITTSADMPATTIAYNATYINNDPQDYYGHGSHVAGIIAGNGTRRHCSQCFRNLQGVAPGVNWLTFASSIKTVRAQIAL